MTAQMLDAATLDRHRRLMAYFPTGVTVVTAIDDDGEPSGMTCSSLTSICLEPPIVMVSLTTTSRTVRQALIRGSFGATLLDVGAQEIAQRFATPALDRFAGLAWTPSPLGVPWIETCMTAAADFELWRSMEVGDHTLLFGLVRNVEIRGGVPLLYGLRRYQGWPPAV
ncbi:MAG TPA: flavin reductase family protein [Jatrophihabitans sp.]|nr:flavin reductase family protein [Jatrophihabitans sp.]